MTTMLETLGETVAAYTSKTRAARNSGGCYYHMPDGRMCAIGRCMRQPERFALCAQRAHELNLDPLLKPEYRGFPNDFWDKLQDLHDDEDNWNETGLTNIGRKNAQLIRETYCLGEIDETTPS